MKRKLFCLLTLLLTVCSGAWAAEETWTTADNASLTRTHFTVALEGNATQLGSSSGNRIKFVKNVSNTMTISTNSGETLDGITFNWKSTPNSTATTSVTSGTWSKTSKNFDTWTKSGSTGPTTVTFTFQDSKDVDIQGITVTYTAGGGGGGATTYVITKDTPSNGTISVDKTTAAEGETVTLTATPAVGYMLDAWDVYKTGESTTKVSVTDNKFTMPAYAVSVNATFVVDSRKKVLYVTSDGKVNAGDNLYAALNEDYNVTKIAYNGSATVTDYDLVVLHESISGSNYNADLVAAAKTEDVPVLNTKSYFYNDGRWGWGTPNAGKTVKVATLNSIAYSNIASHPIFAGITPVDGNVDVVSTAAEKAMQPVTGLVSGKEGYTLATTPNADSGNGTAIHELTPTMRGVSNAKYLMISVSNACLNDLSANGVKLFKNAAAYLMDNSAQWVPAAASYTVTYKANGGTGDDVVVNPATTIAANTFGAPSGKVFIGWNTASDGSGDAWAIGASVTSNLTLFAQWEESVAPVSDEVTFNLMNSSFVVSGAGTTKDGINFKSTGTPTNSYLNFGESSGQTITIAGTGNKRISQVVLTYTGSGNDRTGGGEALTVSPYDEGYSLSGKVGTWTSANAIGDATVTFTTANKARVETVKVTYIEVVAVTGNAYNWITFCNGSALDFRGSDVTAYVVSGTSGTALVKEEVTTVAAGTPLMINATEGTHYVKKAASGTDYNGSNCLKQGEDAAVAAEVGKSRYILTLRNEKAAFAIIETYSPTVPSDKAYLEIEDGGAARSFFFLDDEGETTSLREVRGLKSEVRGEFYDLSGRKVAQPTKGLYIVNGRKVVIK